MFIVDSGLSLPKTEPDFQNIGIWLKLGVVKPEFECICLKNPTWNWIPGSTFVWDQNKFYKKIKTGTGIWSIHTSQEPLNTGRVLGTKWEEKEFETCVRHAPLPLALLG